MKKPDSEKTSVETKPPARMTYEELAKHLGLAVEAIDFLDKGRLLDIPHVLADESKAFLNKNEMDRWLERNCNRASYVGRESVFEAACALRTVCLAVQKLRNTNNALMSEIIAALDEPEDLRYVSALFQRAADSFAKTDRMNAVTVDAIRTLAALAD